MLQHVTSVNNIINGPAFFLNVSLPLFGTDINFRYLYSDKIAVSWAILTTVYTSWLPAVCSLAMVHVSLLKATDKLIVKFI